MTAAPPRRRGLPRHPGGDPWPPAADAAESGVPADPGVAHPAPAQSGVPADAEAPRSPADASAVEAAALAPSRPQGAAPQRRGTPLRRGLPRASGGEPWPPADAARPALSAETAAPAASVETAAPGLPAPGSAASAHAAVAEARPSAPTPGSTSTAGSPPSPLPSRAGAIAVALPSDGPDVPAASADPAGDASAAAAVALRRGLPRAVGGEPWPPPGTVARARDAADGAAASATSAVPISTASATSAVPTAAVQTEPAPADAAAPAGPAVTASAAPEPAVRIPAPAEPPLAAIVAPAPRAPLPFTPTVWAGAAASGPRGPRPEPRRYGPFTRLQWIGAVVVGGIGLLFAAGMAVAATRWLLSTAPLQEFLAAYPGEYHLPVGAPVGFPAWLAWQHFLNTFFLLLIIRSGWQVRREKRPSVFWSPRGNKKRKISLALWWHQALDILWVANGVVFVVLLFVSGQWMRIVPTSWEVFPNALSAALQYVSLDWPTENGWVNYNALQQLAYFTTVFIAAPLAIVTGVRMSGIWPREAATLNRLYPVEWARRVHFPVMLYFVAFVAVHVFLVFATGALRNLNHMYAAQGSTDPAGYADNCAGFWWFAASLVVMAAAWVAARPLTLAPLAALFGTVKGR